MPITINTQALKTRESTSDPWTPAIVRANTDLQPALDITGDGVLSGFPSGVDDLTEAANANRNTLSTYVRPNLLDNWYFVGGGSQKGNGYFPINQRGATTYTAVDYTVDRWKILSSGSTAAISGNYLIYNGNGKNLFQPFELALLHNLEGKTVTLSYKPTLNSPVISGTGVFPAIGTTMELLTLIDNTTTGIRMRVGGWDNTANNGTYGGGLYIDGKSDNNVYIYAIKLELGDTQTLAHWNGTDWVLNEIPDYSEQFEKCCASTADSTDAYANMVVKGTNGYCKMPDGTLICWGNRTSAEMTANVTLAEEFDFPYTFINAPSFTVSVVSSSPHARFVSIIDPTATKGKVELRSTADLTGGIKYHWQAIGRWKT